MRRLTAAMLCISLTLTVCACGKTRGVELTQWEPSALYSNGEIKSAVRCAELYFRQHFSGCELLTISYAGDERSIAESEYRGTDTIVLLSSFYVQPNGGDGSLNQDYTYTGWNWIITKNSAGIWVHTDHGYG